MFQFCESNYGMKMGKLEYFWLNKTNNGVIVGFIYNLCDHLTTRFPNVTINDRNGRQSYKNKHQVMYKRLFCCNLSGLMQI